MSEEIINRGSDEYKSFEDDPSMKWVGDPLPKSICSSCLNRLCDFSCGELPEQEQSLALQTGECSEYIKKSGV